MSEESLESTGLRIARAMEAATQENVELRASIRKLEKEFHDEKTRNVKAKVFGIILSLILVFQAPLTYWAIQGKVENIAQARELAAQRVAKCEESKFWLGVIKVTPEPKDEQSKKFREQLFLLHSGQYNKFKCSELK